MCVRVRVSNVSKEMVGWPALAVQVVWMPHGDRGLDSQLRARYGAVLLVVLPSIRDLNPWPRRSLCGRVVSSATVYYYDGSPVLLIIICLCMACTSQSGW